MSTMLQTGQHQARMSGHDVADALGSGEMGGGSRMGMGGPEEVELEQAQDGRDQGQGGQQHEQDAHDETRGQGAQGLEGGHEESGEGGDDGGCRRGDDLADLGERGAERRRAPRRWTRCSR